MSLELSFGGEDPTKLGVNWYGASSITSIAHLLCVDPIEFGDAIMDIELTVHYPLQPSFLQKKGWAAPPPAPPKNFRQFHRKKAKLEIRWVSQRRTSKDFLSFLKESQSQTVFELDFDDVLDALTYGTETIKPADDFDRAGFLKFIYEQRSMDRGSPTDINKALDHADKLARSRYEALDPWDKLHVDWDEMHPDARTILDDPQDWSQSHDFSPHGNDTGADMFACWPDYENLTAEQAASEIGWGPEFDLTNDLCWKDWVEINLALAFGHIKKTGTCPPDTARQARKALQEDLEKVTTVKSWEHKDNYIAAMTRYCAILDRFV